MQKANLDISLSIYIIYCTKRMFDISFQWYIFQSAKIFRITFNISSNSPRYLLFSSSHCLTKPFLTKLVRLAEEKPKVIIFFTMCLMKQPIHNTFYFSARWCWCALWETINFFFHKRLVKEYFLIESTYLSAYRITLFHE